MLLRFDMVIRTRKGWPQGVPTYQTPSSDHRARKEPDLLVTSLKWPPLFGTLQRPTWGVGRGVSQPAPLSTPGQLADTGPCPASPRCGRSPSLTEPWERAWPEVGGWGTVPEPGLAQQSPAVTNTPTLRHPDSGIPQQTQTSEWPWAHVPPALHILPAPQLTSSPTSTNPDQALVVTCAPMLSFPGGGQSACPGRQDPHALLWADLAWPRARWPTWSMSVRA